MRSEPGTRTARIAYCGPIAQPGQPARGGYESANRRLIDDLRLRGRDVLELPYPVALGSKAAKGLAYLRRFAAIALEMVRQRRRFDILHLTSLYGYFLFPEAVLCLIARGLGKRVVFDVRAGCFVKVYEEYGPVYRAVADAVLRRADLLAVEGQEYLPFVEARRDCAILYLPNYVSGLDLDPCKARMISTHGPLRLVFLGRVVPEKGIEKAIDALESLLADGVDATLDVIGGGEEAYLDELQARTRDLPVAWAGSLSPEQSRSRAAQAHFFVFPSQHRGEGHSNALTEAMSEGLVPVCSEQGFSGSVVAETGRVLPMRADGAAYAAAIAEIWRSGSWGTLSAAAHARIVRNFTGDVVLAGLIASYDAALVESA
jgi:glycosyltransferase involved in cell wall biosynthesis